MQVLNSVLFAENQTKIRVCREHMRKFYHYLEVWGLQGLEKKFW
jgi:hypothetical protein